MPQQRGFLKIEPLIQKVLLDLLSRIHEGGNQEAYRNIERITGIKPTMEQIQEKLLRILFYGNPETYKSIIKFTHIKPTNTQIQKKQIECISENNTNTQSEIITGIKPPKEEIQAMQTGIILKGDYEGYNRLIEETGIKLNEKQIQELKSKIQESELSCLTFGDKKGYNWIVELIGIKLSKLNIQQEELRLLSKGNIGSQAIYEMLVENTGIEPNKQQLEKLKQEER